MTRRQQIEDIIIGTLVCNFTKYWNDVRFCITPDMMQDPLNARTLRRMGELDAMGITPTIKTLTGEDPDMDFHVAHVAIDGDFDSKRAEYHMIQHITGQREYTQVTFDQYVTRYIELHEQEYKDIPA